MQRHCNVAWRLERAQFVIRKPRTPEGTVCVINLYRALRYAQFTGLNRFYAPPGASSCCIGGYTRPVTVLPVRTKRKYAT